MVKGAKASLEVAARHAEVVQAAIEHWAESGMITQQQAAELADTIVVQGFEWQKFAKYTLRLAVLCLVVAVSSVIFEERFVRLYRRVVALPPWMRSAATAVIALCVHVFAYQRTQRLPEQEYANEAVHAIGALFLALAAFQLVEQLSETRNRTTQDRGEENLQPSAKAEGDGEEQERRRRELKARKRLTHNAILCVALGLATVYGAVGLLARSNFIWSCSMIVLGYCCGGTTGYMFGTYSISMDSPLLFIGFGSFLIGTACLMRSHPVTAPLWSTTRTWGLLYFFISLWIMSIWGYDPLIEKTRHKKVISKTTHMFLWSLTFFVAAGACIWHGLRFDDSTTKGFGLTFLGINLYTKFFEYFWGWSKPLFFAVLAGSLAILGRYAEDMWNLRVEMLR